MNQNNKKQYKHQAYDWLEALKKKQRNKIIKNLIEYAIESEHIAFRNEETAKEIAEEKNEDWTRHYGYYYTNTGRLLTE